MNLGSLKKVEMSGACSICLEDLSKPRDIVITDCKHAFHEECMTHHLGSTTQSQRTVKTCPLCRQMPFPMVRAEDLTDEPETNPYIECKMVRALRNQDLDYVNAAILAEPQLIDKLYEIKTSNTKHPLLTLAAMFGHTDLVVSLLEKVSKASIDRFSSSGANALSSACQFGHTQIVKLLIAAGANVNKIDQNGKNAFFLAASAGKKDVMQLLVEFGSSVTNKTNGNFTAVPLNMDKHTQGLIRTLLMPCFQVCN